MRRGAIGIAAFAALFSPLHASAQDAGEFYKGRPITLYISASPGGSYDTYGRLLSRHFARHLAGAPRIVVTNMPGAGGRTVANYVYNVAPKDGSAFAIMQHTTVYDAIFEEKEVRYEPARFGWIGNLDNFIGIAFAWHASGVKTIEDAKNKEISVGSTGRGSTTYQYPALMNAMVGTKFKIVTGYKGSTEIYLAIEQGEMHGMVGTPWPQLKHEHSRWLAEKKVSVFAQLGLAKHPDLPDVPLILDLARNAEDRRIMDFVFAGHNFSRPFFTPPGIPAERLKTLRDAFDAMVKNPQFLEDAKRGNLPISPVGGAEVQRLVAELQTASKDVVEKARATLRAR